MINPKKLFNFLKRKKINFFTGVPDSILKNFTSSIPNNKNFIVANEGSGIALATGYYLKKKKIPCVYMQNSGLGNAVNPLVSLAHKKVYSIPMVLLIGWRGKPGINDEPQHNVMGKITKKILNLLDIKNTTLKNDKDFKNLSNIITYSKINSTPVACLIPPNAFSSKLKLRNNNSYLKFEVKRHEVIETILNIIGKKNNYELISTTGYTSRELNQIAVRKGNLKCKIFYTPGSMGHVGNISLGSSMNNKKKTMCLDGDGSILMHFGSLNDIANFAGKNFKHILFNNNSHESVGGQTTKSSKIDFKRVVMGLGYKNYFQIRKKQELKKKINLFLKSEGPSFLEVKICDGSIKNLTRPKNFELIKKKFIGK